MNEAMLPEAPEAIVKKAIADCRYDPATFHVARSSQWPDQMMIMFDIRGSLVCFGPNGEPLPPEQIRANTVETLTAMAEEALSFASHMVDP